MVVVTRLYTSVSHTSKGEKPSGCKLYLNKDDFLNRLGGSLKPSPRDGEFLHSLQASMHFLTRLCLFYFGGEEEGWGRSCTVGVSPSPASGRP